ncbi:MAG: hypothetical protein KGI50_01465 [Patescibacteria group bacterium]|nr:hypothetical protein [Patescibacteria group bacterium]MDE2437986.1 hypothetical protein [Patescibacteria group bacterium]
MNLQKIINLSSTQKTPFFVYDKKNVKKQINKILTAFQDYPNFELLYAVKANHSKFILEEVKRNGLGIAVSSLQELELAVKYGFESISYTAPYISAEVMRFSKKRKIDINYNNLTEIKQQDKLIGLRINPEVGWSYLKDYAASGINSQFGIPLEEVKIDLARIVRIQMHTSSDSYKINLFIKALEKLLDLAAQCRNIDTINLGGGIATPILREDDEFDIGQFSKRVLRLVNKFNRKYNKQIKLQFEPGNYITRESGYYVCRIMAKEKKYNKIFYFVDGTKHHVRGLHNIQKIFFSRDSISGKRGSNIVGCTCQRSDILVDNIVMPELSIGDLIVIPMAGAYCSVQVDTFHLLNSPRELQLK